MSVIPRNIDDVLSYATDHIATWNTAVTAGGATGANGLTPADITALQTSLTDADASRDAAVTARSTSKSATITQNTDLETLRSLLSQSVSKIKTYALGQADPNAVYAEMDVPAPDTTPTKHYPVTPASLVAQPFANGTVKLTWDSNGNYRNTTFVIEGSNDGASWSQIDTTNSQKITLTGYTPGQTFWFRVAARHNGQTSVPTDNVSIWGGGGSSLSIAA